MRPFTSLPTTACQPNGIYAESESDNVEESHWLITEIDLDTVRRLRTEGQVATRRDWPEQFGV